jgi:hypothetical protein
MLLGGGGAPGVFPEAIPGGFNGFSCDFSLFDDGTFDMAGTTGNWVLPAINDVANFYEAKVDVTVGTLSTGTIGTWLDMGSSHIWTEDVVNSVITVSFREKTTQIVRSVQTGIAMDTV